MTETTPLDVTAWLGNTPGHYFVPLFEEVSPLQVLTRTDGERTLLCRSKEMETAMIDLIESGLSKPNWDGLLYVLGLGDPGAFRILYVGKAERKGVKHDLSANIANIRSNRHKFARWGDGLAYHIGDLSHAMFEFKAYKAPSKKYRRWVDVLFSSSRPPVLKERAYLYLVPWCQGMFGPSGLDCSLPAVEKEVIALAGWQFQDIILNRDGI